MDEEDQSLGPPTFKVMNLVTVSKVIVFVLSLSLSLCLNLYPCGIKYYLISLRRVSVGLILQVVFLFLFFPLRGYVLLWRKSR